MLHCSLENSPHPCSSVPSSQSISPSHTCLCDTHCLPSSHSFDPRRHLRIFACSGINGTDGHLNSSEPSGQCERPSQTRFLEMQRLPSWHLKSSASKRAAEVKIYDIVGGVYNRGTDVLPLDGQVVTQEASSSPSGQSFCPSHSWACERHTDECRHNRDGSAQDGDLGTTEKEN